MIWYQQNNEQLFKALNTSDDGISDDDVLVRIKKYGYNQLLIKKDSIWKIIFSPFKDVFVIVLIIAAIVSLASNESLDAAIIGVIILINALIYYSQEYATTRVIRSLKKHSVQSVSVIRGGRQFLVSSVNLVPGDIVVVNEGERIAADARVIHVDNLQIDEASLTGESVPVYKHASVYDSEKPVFEQDNMVFQGTYVLAGSGRTLVVETGNNTEYSKIAELAVDDESESPVKKKIDNLVSLLVKIVALLAVVVFTLLMIRGVPFAESLRFVLSMTVSAVPEGLPVALTVIIILGMRRMAKKNALVRSFKAIEDIGLLTTIATDKTGTLTKNHLKVVESWSMGRQQVKNIANMTIDFAKKQSDPLDQAIREYIEKGDRNFIDRLFPFDISLRMSGAYVKKYKTIYVKGSPEHILSNSVLSDDDYQKSESVLHELASKGYRVIAFGKVKAPLNNPDDLKFISEGDIDFVGFLAFADELRPEAYSAIRAAQNAGISVRLITGDHYETAYNIGKQLGLATHSSQVIQGSDLPNDITALVETIKNKTIFARILPEDKFRILKALKQTNITAMTGDGVNDVPALSNANIGIAMGSGSDIAKDASGIVILDDNFATIIKAIAEGRKIFDNIRRMLFYLLSTSLGEILTMVGALILGLPLPVTAIQILWINLVTDTAMVLPLGLEPEEDGCMKRSPRKINAPLIGSVLISRIVLIAFVMAVVTLTAVHIMILEGQNIGYIQTVAFLMLIVAQWTNAFNARSEFKVSLIKKRKINYGMLIGLLVAAILQSLVMFGPLASIFDISEVPISVLAISSGMMMFSVFIASEIHKTIVERYQ